MTFKDIKRRADELAKAALIYVPVLFVFTLVSIICFAAKPQYILAGSVLAFMGHMVLFVFTLAPSYLLELYGRMTGRIS